MPIAKVHRAIIGLTRNGHKFSGIMSSPARLQCFSFALEGTLAELCDQKPPVMVDLGDLALQQIPLIAMIDHAPTVAVMFPELYEDWCEGTITLEERARVLTAIHEAKNPTITTLRLEGIVRPGASIDLEILGDDKLRVVNAAAMVLIYE